MAPRIATPLILATLASAAMSETPPCAVENRGYADPNLASVNGGILITDAQTCQNTCAAMANCYVFTYYAADGACWLQGDGLEAKEISGVISGPKVCLSPDGSTLMPTVGPVPTLAPLNVPTTSAAQVGFTPPDAIPGIGVDATAAPSLGAGEASNNGTATCVGDSCASQNSGPQLGTYMGVGLGALALVGLVAYCLLPKAKKTAPKKPKRTKRGIDALPEGNVEEGKPLMAMEAPSFQPPILGGVPQYAFGGGPQYAFQHPGMMMAPQSHQYEYLQPQAYAQPAQYMQQPAQYMQQPVQYVTYA